MVGSSAGAICAPEDKNKRPPRGAELSVRALKDDSRNRIQATQVLDGRLTGDVLSKTQKSGSVTRCVYFRECDPVSPLRLTLVGKVAVKNFGGSEAGRLRYVSSNRETW